MSIKVRTRLAPSPTGYLHIGVLRTALYAFLFAKQNNGKFILRIEDTDQARIVEDAAEVIYRNLKWAGLIYDEGPDVGGDYGPYIQSERKEIYNEYIKKIVDNGNAYYCFCAKDRLEELRKDQEIKKLAPRYDGCCRNLQAEEVKNKLEAGEHYVIRQKMPEDGTTFFDDLVYGKITVNNNDLEDQILMKSDGFPTYNFANVIDDHLMEITHIIRGIEFLSSTPKFNLLYEAFGWTPPAYIHIPPVMKDEHRKISKRCGDASVDDFIAKGYTKEAIINYIALLGWNPGTEKEIFSIDELVKEFSIEKLHKNSAIFDYKKLNWLNGQYLHKMPLEDFHKFAEKWYAKDGRFDIDFKKVSKLLHERVEVPADIPGMIDFLFALPDYDVSLHTHKKMKTDSEIALKVLVQTLKLFTGLSSSESAQRNSDGTRAEDCAEVKSEKFWNEENIKNVLFKQCEDMGLKTGQVMWPARVALSGKQFTPGGAIEIADILGKEESLRRIKAGIEKLKS